MLVNNEIITELYENAGDTRYQKALEYVKDKRVTITNVNYENKNNFELAATVKSSNHLLKTTMIHLCVCFVLFYRLICI